VYHIFDMFGIGAQELMLLLVIILVLFGGKKLPELSKGIGEAVANIRKGFTENETEKKGNSKKTSI
jgi:sec-independent protein translocase protein TatA